MLQGNSPADQVDLSPSPEQSPHPISGLAEISFPACGASPQDTITGETLSDPDSPVVLERMDFPDPVIKVAIEPKTKADVDKMANGLIKLAQVSKPRSATGSAVATRQCKELQSVWRRALPLMQVTGK